MVALFDKYVLRTLTLVVFFMLCGTSVVAQKKNNFDPVKFETDLEQFIASEVGLTPGEASAFFPVYREMRKKQLAYFGEERRLCHVDPTDEKACAEAIRKRDKNDIELKVLQQTYHERFMTMLPATKVFRVLKAENKFHRQFFKKSKTQAKK